MRQILTVSFYFRRFKIIDTTASNMLREIKMHKTLDASTVTNYKSVIYNIFYGGARGVMVIVTG